MSNSPISTINHPIPVRLEICAAQVTPETHSTGLAEIPQQFHFRYQLGFKPEALDGKPHKPRVKLADAVNNHNQHKGVCLRYRAAYVLSLFVNRQTDEMEAPFFALMMRRKNV